MTQQTPSATETYALKANYLAIAGALIDQDYPMDAIDAIVRAQRQADAMLKASVLAARAQGHTWQAIAGVLELTKQGAQQRYA